MTKYWEYLAYIFSLKKIILYLEISVTRSILTFTNTITFKAVLKINGYSLHL